MNIHWLELEERRFSASSIHWRSSDFTPGHPRWNGNLYDHCWCDTILAKQPI
jgi:hypothetical protein